MKKTIISLAFIVTISHASYKNYPVLKDKKYQFAAKDFEKLGIRYLDHLEYAVPGQEMPHVKTKIKHAKYNLKKYCPLIIARTQAPVYIQFINDTIGYGVFAREDIAPGQMIGEYTGVVKRSDFSKRKEDFDYAWGLPKPTTCVIDAKDAGNFTRFINHTDAAFNVDMVCIPCKGTWHLVYIANQSIKKGKQLLANYGKHYWDGRNKKPLNLK